MSMYKTFETDPELERKGVIIEYETFRVTLARAGGSNKRYQRVLEARAKPYRRAIDTKTISKEVQERILMESAAEALILNWEVLDGTDKNGNKKWQQGVEARDGSVMPFTFDSIMETFKNLPDLFYDLQDSATETGIFRKSALEEEAGN